MPSVFKISQFSKRPDFKRIVLRLAIVVLIPLAVNIIFISYLESADLKMTMPSPGQPARIVKAIEDFNIQISKSNEISRINSDIGNLLRYNDYVENDVYLTKTLPSNQNSPDVLYTDLVYNTSTGEKVSTGQQAYLYRNLNGSDAVSKIMNFVPTLTIPPTGIGNAYDLVGYISYRITPDFLTGIVQFFVILFVWFQLIQIFYFVKNSS